MQFFFSSFGDDIFVVRYRNEGNLEKTHVSVKFGFFMVSFKTCILQYCVDIPSLLII